MSIENWSWKPNPDYRRLLKALGRRGDPDNVPFTELGFDIEMTAAVLDEPVLGTHFTDQGRGGKADWETQEKIIDQGIRCRYELGYDAYHAGIGPGLPRMFSLESDDTAELGRHKRHWVDEKAGAITSWADFDRYPWPGVTNVDLHPLEYTAERLPEGMAIMAGVRGILEPMMWLMGYETFSLAIYDQPDLVQAMFDKIEEIVLPVARISAQMDRVIALVMGDDMGFKTGPMIAPVHLRKYVFPLQKKVAALAHEQGKLFLLHACGNLESVMDDLIDDVGIDGRHSFEDVIEPVESFTARYGNRVAVLGGVDMDILARGTEEQVRTRTRQILEACAPSGAYALGSGNTVANYLPVRNFLAMLDEGWRYNTRNT